MFVISQANGRSKVSVCFSVTRVQSVLFHVCHYSMPPPRSPTQIVLGSLFLVWNGTNVAWLCGATQSALKHELFR